MTQLVQLHKVVKHYGSVNALNELSLSVGRGEIVALLGPNGAGKTTAISLLLNLQTADTGLVQLCGKNPDDWQARQQVGVMLQSNALADSLRVSELIELTQNYYRFPRAVDELCTLAGIGDLLPRYYGKLSGGQQRRVQFALAICAHVSVVFLDEPSVGLDIDARASLWRSIKQLASEGCAVVLTTHYLEEAEALAKRVIVMLHGRVVAEGSVDDIRARVAQRQIRCITRLDPQLIAQWPDVAHVQHDGAYLLIHSAQADAVVRQLMLSDESVQQLEIKRAGLAEAFTEITRESAG